MLGSRTSSTWMHMLGPNPRSPDSQTLGFQFPAICFNTSCKCFWDMFNFEIQWRRSYILIQMFYLPVQIISLLMLVIHMFNKMVHISFFKKHIHFSTKQLKHCTLIFWSCMFRSHTREIANSSGQYTWTERWYTCSLVFKMFSYILHMLNYSFWSSTVMCLLRCHLPFFR